MVIWLFTTKLGEGCHSEHRWWSGDYYRRLMARRSVPLALAKLPDAVAASAKIATIRITDVVVERPKRNHRADSGATIRFCGFQGWGDKAVSESHLHYHYDYRWRFNVSEPDVAGDYWLASSHPLVDLPGNRRACLQTGL